MDACRIIHLRSIYEGSYLLPAPIVGVIKSQSPSLKSSSANTRLRNNGGKHFVKMSRHIINPQPKRTPAVILEIRETLYGRAFCISSASCLRDNHVINDILNWSRSRRPLQGATWWYLHPNSLSRLEDCLLAQGMYPNWEPHWMWCERAHST